MQLQPPRPPAGGRPVTPLSTKLALPANRSISWRTLSASARPRDRRRLCSIEAEQPLTHKRYHDRRAGRGAQHTAANHMSWLEGDAAIHHSLEADKAGVGAIGNLGPSRSDPCLAQSREQGGARLAFSTKNRRTDNRPFFRSAPDPVIPQVLQPERGLTVHLES
jgi:hypothetical protein